MKIICKLFSLLVQITSFKGNSERFARWCLKLFLVFLDLFWKEKKCKREVDEDEDRFELHD
jgi:hypothetical protein